MNDTSGTPKLADLRRQWETTHAEPVLLRLADACRRKGLLDEAVAVLRDGVRRHSRRLAPRIALGRYLYEAGDLAAAVEMLGGVVDQDPTQLVANKLLVEVHLARSEVDQAASRLDLYGLLNPGDPGLAGLENQVKAARRREQDVATDAPARPPSQPAAVPAQPPVPVIAARPGPEAGTQPQEAGRLWAPLRDQVLFPGGEPADSASYWSTVAAGPFGGAIRQRAETRGDLDSLPTDPVAATARPSSSSAPPPPPATISPAGEPTVTLGRLYLQQGHPQEAARIFRQVLHRDPSHAGAQEGMSAVAALSPPLLRAADLLAAAKTGNDAASRGGSERRQTMLRSYLQAILGRA